MRSGMNSIVSCSEVHQWALLWLMQGELLKNRARICTAQVVWSILLRAAARMTSVFAACRDLANAPTQEAVFDALMAGLPKTLSVLEKRLNWALTNAWPRRLQRRCWQVAIDWHLVPYYGEAHKSRNEIYRCQRRAGTTHFHAYATACIVQYGHRYTLALTWVRRHESMVVVLRRLIARIRELGVKTKVLLLDRAFYATAVMALLQEEKLPFLMPVMVRGRLAKKTKKSRARKQGIRWIKRQKAGSYPHSLKNGKQNVEFRVFVAYRTYFHRKKRQRKQQKLLFAAWRVHGAPTEIRERYRKRFGIESSFRQLRQARIYTCTRNPHLRLVFVAVALLLRNLWVWIHATKLAEGRGLSMTLRLELLRFKRMLDWIALAVTALLHDGSMPCVDLDELG
jgi:cell division protein ZapA (FtsZ GTPase activity inhibitor)